MRLLDKGEVEILPVPKVKLGLIPVPVMEDATELVEFANGAGPKPPEVTEGGDEAVPVSDVTR